MPFPTIVERIDVAGSYTISVATATIYTISLGEMVGFVLAPSCWASCLIG